MRATWAGVRARSRRRRDPCALPERPVRALGATGPRCGSDRSALRERPVRTLGATGPRCGATGPRCGSDWCALPGPPVRVAERPVRVAGATSLRPRQRPPRRARPDLRPHLDHRAPAGVATGHDWNRPRREPRQLRSAIVTIPLDPRVGVASGPPRTPPSTSPRGGLGRPHHRRHDARPIGAPARGRAGSPLVVDGRLRLHRAGRGGVLRSRRGARPSLRASSVEAAGSDGRLPDGSRGRIQLLPRPLRPGRRSRRPAFIAPSRWVASDHRGGNLLWAAPRSLLVPRGAASARFAMMRVCCSGVAADNRAATEVPQIGALRGQGLLGVASWQRKGCWSSQPGRARAAGRRKLEGQGLLGFASCARVTACAGEREGCPRRLGKRPCRPLADAAGTHSHGPLADASGSILRRLRGQGLLA